MKDQIELIEDEERKQNTEELFSDCFQSVQSLQSIIEDKLWEHIYRCMELSQLDPAALVRALTIIEKNQRRKNKAQEMAKHGGKVARWVLEDRDWVEECKDRLLTAIHRRCERAYSVRE